MSLPLASYVVDPARTTAEMKTIQSDMIGQIKKGIGVDYLSTTTYLTGEVVVASNDVIYTSQTASNLNNNPISDDGTNWKADPYLNYKGDYSDLTGSFSAGMSLTRNGDLWQAISDIADITLSAPSGSNSDFIMVTGGVFDFVVSQYANGDETEVVEIESGIDASLYTYFIYKSDNRVYSNLDGVTGTFAGDFDPDTGVDSGLSGALSNISLGTAAQQNLTSGGTAGDVFHDGDVATSTDITSGTGRLPVTPEELADSEFGFGVGQTRQNVTASRSLDTLYTNTTGKPIEVEITFQQSGTSVSNFTIDGTDYPFETLSGTAGVGSRTFTIPNGATYQFKSANINQYNWYELR